MDRENLIRLFSKRISYFNNQGIITSSKKKIGYFACGSLLYTELGLLFIAADFDFSLQEWIDNNDIPKLYEEADPILKEYALKIYNDDYNQLIKENIGNSLKKNILNKTIQSLIDNPNIEVQFYEKSAIKELSLEVRQFSFNYLGVEIWFHSLYKPINLNFKNNSNIINYFEQEDFFKKNDFNNDYFGIFKTYPSPNEVFRKLLNNNDTGLSTLDDAIGDGIFISLFEDLIKSAQLNELEKIQKNFHILPLKFKKNIIQNFQNWQLEYLKSIRRSRRTINISFILVPIIAFLGVFYYEEIEGAFLSGFPAIVLLVSFLRKKHSNKVMKKLNILLFE